MEIPSKCSKFTKKFGRKKKNKNGKDKRIKILLYDIKHRVDEIIKYNYE
jgi:hypothetical protein